METEYIESEGLPYPFGSKRDILTFLFKQKKIIITVFVLSLFALGYWVYTTIPLYEASARFLLKFGRENIYRAEVGNKSHVLANTDQFIASEIDIISSTDLVSRVVEAISVSTLYPALVDPLKNVKNPVERATAKFLGKLSAEPIKGSNVIKVSFLHPNPEIAAKAVNLLIDFLKEKHLKIFSDPKASFLENQLQVYKAQLEEWKADLQDFKHRHRITSSPDRQQDRLLNQRVQFDTNYKSAKNRMQGLKSKISSLGNQMETILQNIPTSTVEKGGNLAKAKADLFDLKRKEQGLLTRYTETSFPVLNIRKEIDLVEKFILVEQKGERANTVASGNKQIYKNLELKRLEAVSELETVESQNKVFESQISELDEKIQELDMVMEEMQVIERKIETAQKNYTLYLVKVDEALVSEEMDRQKMSGISVIQAAEVPRLPAGRSRILILVVGIIAGVMASVGVAFVVEYLQGAYVRPDQAAEDLDLPVLATLSPKF